jgi:hypothetical protein
MNRRYRINQDQKNRIDELFAQHGGILSEELLLKEAKKQSSILHDLFPWDDRECGYLYRLRVAGRVLRSYTIIKIKYAEGKTSAVSHQPIAIKVKPTEEADKKAWVAVKTVLSDEGMSHRAMVDMLERVRRFNQQLKVFPQVLALHKKLEIILEEFRLEPAVEERKSMAE